MALSLEIVLGGVLLAAAALALATSPRTAPTTALCLGLMAIGGTLVIAVPVEAVEAALRRWHLVRGLEVAAGLLGAVAGWRLPDRRIGLMLAAAGGLLALHAVRLVGGWAL